MNGFEYSILFGLVKLYKRASIHGPGDSFDCLQAKAVSLVVGWHVGKTVAVNLPVKQAIIDIVQNRNFMCLVAVILWQQTVADCLHQLCLFG